MSQLSAAHVAKGLLRARPRHVHLVQRDLAHLGLAGLDVRAQQHRGLVAASALRPSASSWDPCRRYLHGRAAHGFSAHPPDVAPILRCKGGSCPVADHHRTWPARVPAARCRRSPTHSLRRLSRLVVTGDSWNLETLRGSAKHDYSYSNLMSVGQEASGASSTKRSIAST